MRRNSVTRSPSDKSIDSGSVSVSVSSSFDANAFSTGGGGGGGTTAKRRNSWHRQEEDSITQVLERSGDGGSSQMYHSHYPPTRQNDLGMSDLAGPSSSTAQQQQHPRRLHRSDESQHSLESVQSIAPTDGDDGDDQVHLTSAPGGSGGGRGGSSLRWKTNDPESGSGSGSHSQHGIASTGHRRRRLDRPAGHYGETSTPRRTIGTLKSVSRNIRRMSVRVVNLAGITLEDRPIRLEDDDDDDDRLKTPVSPMDMTVGEQQQQQVLERLRGRTLGVFGPKSGIRKVMLDMFLWRWTEPAILLLIMADAVILAVQAHRSVFMTPRPDGYFKTWEDYALFALFVVFTLEMFGRIIVTGLIFDPESRITDLSSLKSSFIRTKSKLQANADITDTNASTVAESAAQQQQQQQQHMYPPAPAPTAPSAHHMRERTTSSLASTWVGSRLGLERHPFQLAIEKQQSLSERNLPYLRHSWNRIDFIAVVSFWIMFVLAISRVETQQGRHLYLFRALSVLRVSRLLAVTSGTTTIMRSLKIAAPLLANVALFVMFAVVLFSIVGVQSFKGSLRRNCILVDSGGNGNITLGQSCGGQIDPASLNRTGYYSQQGVPTGDPKGYICPLGQICQEGSTNPESNIQSFDNIFVGALQVLIIAGANGWAPTMYTMMDADFYVSSIFFIVCIVILNFWLINMFVAVITNTFGSIRAGTQKSAFGAGTAGPVIDEKEEGWSMITGTRRATRSRVQQIYIHTKIAWVFLIFIDLAVQGTRSASSSPSHLQFLDSFELVATIAFDLEMVWRIWGYFPDWRAFGEKGSDNLDFLLAVITTVIQIPVIKHSSVYAWLTIFQLLRFYRVILAVPTMRPLLLRVFGNLNGLFNMTLFLLITNVLGALIAVQLFRGDVPADNNMNFAETYTAFLAMYQVFSSENWTNVLYLVATSETPYQQAVIAILFFVAWFVFANFIMLQMFIAVINENFEVAEEQKRARQFDQYLRRAEPTAARINWLDRWNPYHFVKAAPSSLRVDSMPSALVLPLRSNVVPDSRTRRQGNMSQSSLSTFAATERPTGFTGTLRRLFDLDRESIPMSNLRSNRRESALTQGITASETQNTEYAVRAPAEPAHDEKPDEIYEEEAQRADFIDAHPTYDKTFWLLSNENPLRYLCQKVVSPSTGTRLNGAEPSPLAEPLFKLIIILAVIGGIVVAAESSPMHRRSYYQKHGLVHNTWFDIADTVFGAVLIMEFLVKVMADGLIFTPNAYLLSVWNLIDFVILIALLVNMVTTIVVVGGLGRLTRALRAFRALRLITMFPWMRDTLYSVLFAGAKSLFEAALLAFLYMVPYAIWGVNLFSGLMFTCNDTNSSGKSACINEYINQPIDGSNLGFIAPRAWDKPAPSTTFSFDNFGNSLLILFEIVSFEGWIDVMTFAMDLAGRDNQPQINQTQLNSIFFVTYDLLGAVIILTLFVSIIIGNFSSRSGMALLTEEQKQWIDLQKLIRRQGPSKRPKFKPSAPIRAWCYDRAVSKNGWWSRLMTLLYIVHITALATQTFSNGVTFNDVRNFIFLVLTSLYLVDIVIRVTGLGIRSFAANGWNLFDVLVVTGSFGTTVPIILGSTGFVVEQLQKLFLVCIAFKLVQKNSSLNQLFKTAVSSLGAILKLLLLWFTLFIFFAIVYVEVFGLTRWESAETRYQNYREFSNALIMLAFMCLGEGWNQYMHDFTVSYPRCTKATLSDPDSDCGSTAWAYSLFVAWNLLSMYIFVNMFTGLVVENFSYVFQLHNSQTSINRQEMRSFKKIWAQFDVAGTGYLQSTHLVPFLARLSGVFEIKIYPTEYSVHVMIDRCQASETEARTIYSAPVVEGIDLRLLGSTLSQINQRDTRKRRLRWNRLYQEARGITAEPGKGISFTNMLLLLAHYKMINDDTALQVEELIERRQTTELVDELVNTDRVLSLLKMIACRRRYTATKEAKAAALRAEQQGEIPAIVVDEDEPKTPQHRSWDITQADRDSQGFKVGDDSPSSSPIRVVYTPESPIPGGSAPSSPVRGRYSDASISPSDYLGSHRDSIAYKAASPQQVMSTLDSSVWGEMMQDEDE